MRKYLRAFVRLFPYIGATTGVTLCTLAWWRLGIGGPANWPITARVVVQLVFVFGFSALCFIGGTLVRIFFLEDEPF